MAWTRERLETVARERLGGARLIVVANREPYIHRSTARACAARRRRAAWRRRSIRSCAPAAAPGWPTAAATPTGRSSTTRGRVRVPPDGPRYTLRRVWLTKEEEQGYYYGLANEALWPLCHVAFTRPRFDAERLGDIPRGQPHASPRPSSRRSDGGPAVVFIQDYHFALLPRLLKQARPDLVVAQFWHIPWPNREMFRDLSRGRRSSSTACSATTCWRSTSQTTATTSSTRSTGTSSRASIYEHFSRARAAASRPCVRRSRSASIPDLEAAADCRRIAAEAEGACGGSASV